MSPSIHAVLFDLDGTLLDTAPDMIEAINLLRGEYALAPLPEEQLRPAVSHGATVMLQVALASHSSDLSFEQCRRRFLEIYSANLAQYTSLFPGMEGVLTHLETHGILWGVVTNKPSYLTLPLMKQLNLHERSHITVSGDTTSESKPHPLPLIHACQQIGVECAHTLYIGDAQRDIEAGKAAGMTTLIALYGYLGPDDTPQEWGADGCISHPLEILSWIK